MTTLEKTGARLYFRGAPYAAKDILKGAGCHWDADSRAWWIGAAKALEASTLLARVEAVGQVEAAKAAELPPAAGPMVEVPGKTYPAREKLRALGGSWDGAAKVWRVPESRLELAKQAVAAIAKTTAPNGSTFRRRDGGRCRGCGGPVVNGRAHRAMNGYCGDCAFDEYDC